MSRSWKAIKRDIREYCENHSYDDNHYCPYADLSRHPNGKRKRSNSTGRMVTYGSDKHMNRKSLRRAKQEERQRRRAIEKEEANQMIEQLIQDDLYYITV